MNFNLSFSHKNLEMRSSRKLLSLNLFQLISLKLQSQNLNLMVLILKTTIILMAPETISFLTVALILEEEKASSEDVVAVLVVDSEDVVAVLVEDLLLSAKYVQKLVMMQAIVTIVSLPHNMITTVPMAHQEAMVRLQMYGCRTCHVLGILDSFLGILHSLRLGIREVKLPWPS